MFCVFCGAKDAGKFCVRCGRAQPSAEKPLSVAVQERLELPETLIPEASLSSQHRAEEICDRAFELASELTDSGSSTDQSLMMTNTPSGQLPPPLPVPYQGDQPKLTGGGDWVNSIDYETVLHAELPRDRITMAARRSRQGIGGEDLLKLFDKVSPYGIPLEKINNTVLPIYEKLGIKTSKQATVCLNAPSGHVMLAVLCMLAERGLGISDVRQTETQCTLVAELPLGFVTNRGRLFVTLQRLPADRIELAIAAEILGQVYDWGRSKRLSEELIVKIDRELKSIAASAAYQAHVA